MHEFKNQMVIAEIPDEILAHHRIHRDDLEVVLGRPETYIRWFILSTPVLWLTGALLPAAMILFLWLLWRIPARKYLTDWLVLSWWLVSFVQAVSVFFNWIDSPESSGFLVRQLLSFTTTGWFVMGAALAIGKYSRFDSKEIVRDASILALYFIIFGTIAFLIYIITKEPTRFVASPFGYLLPERMSITRFFFTIRFYSLEELFGKELPRLVLFYPWPLIMSFAGVGLLFMTIFEHSKVWKYIGITGAVFAIVGTMGRMGFIAAALSLLIFYWGKLRPAAKWAAVIVGSTVLLSLVSFQLGSGMLDSTMATIEKSRAGSSEARRLGYELTWAAINQSPVIGYGWVGDLISEEIPMPLGSHSTILGILYTGGAVTFAAFCLAVMITLFSFLNKLAGSGDSKRLSAFCIFLALLLFTTTEGINYFFISNLIILFWLGMALTPVTAPDDEADNLFLYL
jgi:hypothetical protein